MASSAPPDALVNTKDGLTYWEGVSADENGMLGGIPSINGFAYISKVDLQGSRNFLAKLGIGTKPGLRVVETALEGGAGIGRITAGLLSSVAQTIDVIEPISRFTSGLQERARCVRRVFNCGLEEWEPSAGHLEDEKGGYDLIWTQWCVGHLTDAQLVGYLRRCGEAVRRRTPMGVIVLKENLSTSGEDAFDEEDSSVTREDAKYRSLFEQAGLQIVRMEMQKGLPETAAMKLLPVKMYALRPKARD